MCSTYIWLQTSVPNRCCEQCTNCRSAPSAVYQCKTSHKPRSGLHSLVGDVNQLKKGLNTTVHMHPSNTESGCRTCAAERIVIVQTKSARPPMGQRGKPAEGVGPVSVGRLPCSSKLSPAAGSPESAVCGGNGFAPPPAGPPAP